MSFQELSNIQIDAYYRGNPLYGGCFSKNETYRLRNGFFYILNMDKPTNGGSHWVLLSTISKAYAIYFDSFALQPPEEIEAWINRYRGGKVQLNGTVLQRLNSSACGYFSLFCGDMITKGMDLYSILHFFSHSTTKNENLLQDYFKYKHLLK